MRSKFSIAGHPIHPMLVALPIGLLVWALVADVIYLATGREQTWYDISFWSGIAGVVTGLVAALPGLGDYVTLALRHEGARGAATAHMLLNVGAITVYAVAAWLMLDNGAIAGGALTAVIALHASGAAMLGISGWLGGELVYRHGFGMMHGATGDEAHGSAGEPRRAA